MPALELDIVIVNYNSTDDLADCLRSLEAGGRSVAANVFVQDNASTDDPGRLARLFPQIDLELNPRNLGLGAAINQAARRGRAPFLLLLNPDSLLSGQCLEHGARALADNPDVGAVGPRILNSDGTVQGSARAFPSLSTALFGRSSLLSRLLPNNRFTAKNVLTKRANPDQPMEVDWVSLAAAFVRREAFVQAGMMDEAYFLYWEDADLCKRLWNHGWKVVYDPRAALTHKVGGSRKSRSLLSLWHFHKSCLLFFGKHARRPVSLLWPLVAMFLGLRFGLLAAVEALRAARREPPSGH